jgi:hypothetical protein
MADYITYWRRVSADRWDWGEQIDSAGSNNFRRVSTGDTIWIVASDDDGLYLLAKIIVGEVLERAQAVKKLGKDIWEADYTVTGAPGSFIASKRIAFEPIALDLEFSTGTTVEAPVRFRQFWALRRSAPRSGSQLEQIWSDPSER